MGMGQSGSAESEKYPGLPLAANAPASAQTLIHLSSLTDVIVAHHLREEGLLTRASKRFAPEVSSLSAGLPIDAWTDASIAASLLKAKLRSSEHSLVPRRVYDKVMALDCEDRDATRRLRRILDGLDAQEREVLEHMLRFLVLVANEKKNHETVDTLSRSMASCFFHTQPLFSTSSQQVALLALMIDMYDEDMKKKKKNNNSKRASSRPKTMQRDSGRRGDARYSNRAADNKRGSAAKGKGKERPSSKRQSVRIGRKVNAGTARRPTRR